MNVDKIILRLLAAVFLVGCWKAVPAQAAEEIKERQMEHLSDTRSWFQGVYLNPAMQWDRYRYSLNRLGITGEYSRATTPQQPEHGDKATVMGADIDAFLRKKSVSLWGIARYGNARMSHVAYSETTDFDLLYPYVMADTIGGGTSRKENYDFMGGFACRKNLYTVGLQGRYTAQLEYRTVDPRPKNLSGYLRLNVGAVRSGFFNKTYEGGFSVGFRRYKQTNEIEFYNETSRPVVYHLTGLGMDYYRFRGSYSSTYYKGLGWNATLELRPVAYRNGIYASLGYACQSTEKIISDLNELPLTKLNLRQQALEIGYLHRSGRSTWGVKLSETCDDRRGTENIFGSAKDNIYPKIASGRRYRELRYDLLAGILYQYRPAGTAIYGISLVQHYRNVRETYVVPWRKMYSSAQVSALSLKGVWQRKRWLWQTSARLNYVWGCQCDMVLNGNINESMMAPVYRRYALYGNKRCDTQLRAEVGYAVNRSYSLFVAVDWQYAHYMKTRHANLIHLSLGMDF